MQEERLLSLQGPELPPGGAGTQGALEALKLPVLQETSLALNALKMSIGPVLGIVGVTGVILYGMHKILTGGRKRK